MPDPGATEAAVFVFNYKDLRIGMRYNPLSSHDPQTSMIYHGSRGTVKCAANDERHAAARTNRARYTRALFLRALPLARAAPVPSCGQLNAISLRPLPAQGVKKPSVVFVARCQATLGSGQR